MCSFFPPRQHRPSAVSSGGMEESTSFFRPGGRFTFPTEKKKEKKFSCFPYFWQVYFFRHFSSNKISFPTHGIANSGDRKAKEKLNYGPSFCTMPQKVGEEDVCIG